MSFETEGDRTARIAAAARRIIAAQRLSDEKAHLEEGFEWRKSEPEEKKVPPPRRRDCVVMVKDGTLVEDSRFEAGVTYVMEEMEPFDQDMVVVYDKFGEKGTYFRDRFEFVFE